MLATLQLFAVYLGSAVLVLWLVHRTVRRLTGWAAAVLLLLPMAMPGPAMVRGEVYAPMDALFEHLPWSDHAEELGVEPRPTLAGDLPFQIIPWHKAVRDAWAAGEWPLWNPYMLAGDLLAASAQPAPFHPLNLASLLLPLDLSVTYQAAAMLFLAAVGFFLFARELGCSELPSLLGAVAWTFCGFLSFWLLWPMAAAVLTMPWIAAGVRRLFRGARTPDRPRLPPWGLLAASLSLLLLSGHPESMLHLVTLGSLYGLLELALNFGPGPAPPRERLAAAGRVVAAGILAGVFAGGVAAIHLLPIVDALPDTAMYELRQSHFADLDHSVPWIIARERMNTVLLPFRFGMTWTEETLPAPGFFVPMSSAYVGTAALGLALFGLWRNRWRGRWFFAVWAVVGVAAGAGAPGVTHALAALPLFDLSIHRRWVFAAAWSLATLVALGADAWLEHSEAPARPARRGRRLAACFGVVVVAAGLALWENWDEMRHPAEGDGLSSTFLTHHGLLLLLPALAAGLLSVFGGRLGGRRILWCLLALLVAQRAGELSHRFPSLDRQLFAPDVTILSAIPESDEPARFVGVDWTLLPNTSAYYGLEDVRGYQPMSSDSYTETFGLWDTAPAVYFNEVTDLDAPFLDLLNVRWAVAHRSFRPPDGWRFVTRHGHVQLLENTEVLPRAYLPRNVILDDPRVRMRMASVGSFSHLSFVDTPAEDARGHQPIRNGRGTVAARRDGTGLRLSVQTEEAAWLVVSEPSWSGWRAVRIAADGERTPMPVHTANHAFLALEAPAGSYEVELYFSPMSFRIGRAVTAVTLFTCVLWLALVRTRILRAGHDVKT